MDMPSGYTILPSMLALVNNTDWSQHPFIAGHPKVTTKTIPGKTTETSTEKPQGKTLWDWLQLLGVLAIPVVVGFGTLWFTKRQAKESAAENMDNQREKALQSYIDNISELLLKEKLRESQPEGEVQIIARVRTLTILSRLDSMRKRNVLQFLYESRLLEKGKSIVKLHGADLSSANLEEANLSRANLSRANLSRAKLYDAKLRRAKLYGARLSGATLDGADLHDAEYNTQVMQEKNEQGKPITIEKTQWPSDFNFEKLKAAGAICVDCETP